jgi:hypothetical protein
MGMIAYPSPRDQWASMAFFNLYKIIRTMFDTGETRYLGHSSMYIRVCA